MSQIVSTETLIIQLLLIVSLVAILVRRLRVPYTVALVVVGLLLTFGQPITFELTHEILLALFVPPLIFEAAFHLEIRHLRERLLPILVLAIPGVLLTTLIIGLIVSAGVGLPLWSGLVFGALMAATDPVAVIALFRTLSVPKKLAVTMEGESLFNDGTAIVVFNLVLATALAGTGGTGGSFDGLTAVIDFLRVSAGGLLIGGGAGWLVARIIERVDDYLIETTLTTVLAFGSYLLAEQFHVSGVLAVVAAGMVCGNIGPKGMSPTTRIVLFSFWEYLAFVVNSLVFLMIGLDVNLPQLAAYPGPIAIAVVAVLLSRALVVYGLCGLVNLRRKRIPLAEQHVLFWGGLRGAIGLALVLSLPATLADRELLRVMAFGVVLFTLLVQGTTMSPLLRHLNLLERSLDKLAYERHQGRLLALHAAYERVEQLYKQGMYSAATWEQMSHNLTTQIEVEQAAQQHLREKQPALQAEELASAQREGLHAQRAVLASLLSEGIISEPVYTELVTTIDAALDTDLDVSAV